MPTRLGAGAGPGAGGAHDLVRAKEPAGGAAAAAAARAATPVPGAASARAADVLESVQIDNLRQLVYAPNIRQWVVWESE